MSDLVVITAAVNGAEVTREHHPNLPLTPEEIGDEAVRCEAAGASIIHLHGRLPDGTPTQDVDTFRDYYAAIRDRTRLVVQFSTGGAVGMEVDERIEALSLQPSMATLTTGTVNFGDGVFMNDLPTIREIASRLHQFRITPEIEVFEVGMLDTAKRLVDDGVLRGPLHVDFVLGVPGAMAASTGHLDYLIQCLPEGWTWCVAGIGRHELPLAQHALDRGGHVRVGLEDNLYLSKGVLADGTYALVERVAEMAQASGRTPATSDETRRILKLGEIRYPVG